MHVLYSNSRIFVIPVYIFNGRKQTLVDTIGILSAMRMRGLHDKRHLLAKLRIAGSENCPWTQLPEKADTCMLWEPLKTLINHKSTGGRDLTPQRFARWFCGKKIVPRAFKNFFFGVFRNFWQLFIKIVLLRSYATLCEWMSAQNLRIFCIWVQNIYRKWLLMLKFNFGH